MPALTIRSSRPDGVGLQRVEFDTPLAGHTTPGQFLIAFPDGTGDGVRQGFFALANTPGEPVELLIKRQGDVAEAVSALPPGAVLHTTEAQGAGFQVPAEPLPLVLLVAGSGLSAVRGLIELEVAAGLPRPVHLFYGAFTPAHLAYAERLAAWTAAGVSVRPVLGTPPAGWPGAVGFAQHAAADAGLCRADVIVVAAGFPQMVEEARAMWAAAGQPAERFCTNW